MELEDDQVVLRAAGHAGVDQGLDTLQGQEAGHEGGNDQGVCEVSSSRRAPIRSLYMAGLDSPSLATESMASSRTAARP